MSSAPIIRYVVVDVNDVDRAVAYWGGLLEVGVAGRDGHFTWLEGHGPGPTIVLQAVTDEKRGKNRVHLDLLPSDPPATLARVEQLGGTIVGRIVEPDHALTVVADPDGNEHCIIERGSAVTRSRRRAADHRA